MILLAALLLIGPPTSARSGEAAPGAAAGCADILTAIHRLPPHAVFAGCRLLPDAQGKPLRATYRVAGRYAAAAEAYLVKTMGLTPLRRSCCQWDAPRRRFVDGHGREGFLAMVSDDTAVARRAQWARIPRFEITVDMLTEDI